MVLTQEINTAPTAATLHFEPLTTGNWQLLLQLFGYNGACGGCWCMTWRLPANEYEKNKGAKNCDLFHQLIEKKEPVGIIAFESRVPIGWCSVSPREKLVRLKNSRIFKSIDNEPVWSITCLYIEKGYRKKGVSAKLIIAASKYAFANGARIVEAYPLVPPADKPVPDLFAYHGLESAYKKAGFIKVKQASDNRLIMRCYGVHHQQA